MKLQKWMITFSVLVLSMMHYSLSAQANDKSTSVSSMSANSVYMQDTAQVANSVNINTASAEELSSLPGVGMKKAEAIINYRELNGDFASTEEIVNVKGIGPKMLEKISALITI